MSRVNDDWTFHRVCDLRVIQPDPARADEVRRRCRAVLHVKPPQSARATRRMQVPGLIIVVALSAGLAVGMIQDVVQVYLRQ
jgi:hypothetical protein